jgi:hypothetical protein
LNLQALHLDLDRAVNTGSFFLGLAVLFSRGFDLLCTSARAGFATQLRLGDGRGDLILPGSQERSSSLDGVGLESKEGDGDWRRGEGWRWNLVEGVMKIAEVVLRHEGGRNQQGILLMFFGFSSFSNLFLDRGVKYLIIHFLHSLFDDYLGSFIAKETRMGFDFDLVVFYEGLLGSRLELGLVLRVRLESSMGFGFECEGFELWVGDLGGGDGT